LRAESDLEGPDRGPDRSQIHACGHCGLPLAPEVEFCPYCERWQDESTLPRLLAGRGARRAGRRIAGMSERVLLVVGVTLFALVAAASIAAALAT
jgi:hypothetical protein